MPAEEERNGEGWNEAEDEAEVTRTLRTMGAVGVPSMPPWPKPLRDSCLFD